ncbi:hypothetical protein EYM_00445 [Ignicoccus islandicus DSM 13165]|uniref:DUF2286 domain-containing protein n=1 Tax=Ignicoccus islandicus DSM 13165 TaxID=940295 RepID=A0A0U3FP58_9CREN|nr:DUF2286 domain-containing protein [Ignicoccus islandicus]ALU12111.1 hypothetical protein EYM_00445 [Ignicoccus islandicus DSM 13165]
MKLVVISHDPDSGTNVVVLDNELNKVVKLKALTVLENEWNPDLGEFSVLRDNLELEYQLPLKKEQYEVLKNFNMRKEGKTVKVSIPYYVIMYPKYGYEGSPYVIYLISPYLEDAIEDLKALAQQASTGVAQEPQELLEEE